VVFTQSGGRQACLAGPLRDKRVVLLMESSAMQVENSIYWHFIPET